MTKGYTTVSIPDEILNEIDEEIKDHFLSYRSRSEFIIERLGKRLEEIIKLRIEREKIQK